MSHKECPISLQRMASTIALVVFALSIVSFTEARSQEPECALFKSRIDNLPVSDEEKDQFRTIPDIQKDFIWDNDSLYRGGDLHYTNGMKLSWIHNPCRGESLNFKNAFKYILDSFPSGDDRQRQYFTGGSFGMNMYTPRDIEVSARQRNDRPYSGWLYAGIRLQAVDTPKFTSKSAPTGLGQTGHELELQVGVIGPKSGQGPIQKWWHEDVGTSNRIPNWDTQVPGRLGLNVSYSHWRNYFLDAAGRFRASPMVGFSVGNVQTYATVGGMIAVGSPFNNSGISLNATGPARPLNVGGLDYKMQTQSRKLRRADDSLTMELVDQKAADDMWLKCSLLKLPNCRWSLFVGVEQRYILNSIFIEGAGEAQHDISLVRNVGDFYYGGSLQVGKLTSLSLKLIVRSMEFRSQDKSLESSHRIGRFEYLQEF